EPGPYWWCWSNSVLRTLLLVTVLGVVLVVLLYVRFGPRLRRIRARHAFMAVAVVFFAAVVALFTAVTIDLGPSLRGQAERAGSNYLKRTMTIGRLSIHLWTGKFIVEDLVIGGLTPESRPWLTAKRIAVSM